MATLYFRGRIESTPAAITILVDGAEVFSGQVGLGQPLDTEIDLATVNTSGSSVSVSVTSGVILSGSVLTDVTTRVWAEKFKYNPYTWVVNNGTYYMTKVAVPANTPITDTNYWTVVPQVGTVDCRNNDILINGQAPEWPATAVTVMPGGTEQESEWDGWFFELGAGETITYTVTPAMG
jgi:hypothetical protein